MRVRGTDGVIFEEDTASAIIERLCRDQPISQTVEAYKEELKERIRLLTGYEPTFTNDGEFLRELVKVGLIQIIG